MKRRRKPTTIRAALLDAFSHVPGIRYVGPEFITDILLMVREAIVSQLPALYQKELETWARTLE